MDFVEYQVKAVGTDIYKDIRDAALGLASETGEVAGKISKAYRDNEGEVFLRENLALAQEIGDVLWGCACLANRIRVPLNDIAEMNLAKLKDRYERGKIGGSGDQR